MSKMIIVMKPEADESCIMSVKKKLEAMDFEIHRDDGKHHVILGVIGDTRKIDDRMIKVEPGVSEVIRITEPYKLAGRSFHPANTIIPVNDLEIGGDEVIIIAGPCSVESETQINAIAGEVSQAGAKILRGGAFKPRSSPYSFQGLGIEGLKLLHEAAKTFNMATISEVMDTDKIDVIAEYVDILQIGARNMQNFSLLKEVGKMKKPVFLKRGLAATIEELLMAAEYIMANGNSEVILCERGIRTFETYTRNTMDISAIPVIKSLSHLPVFADPSHATGERNKVRPMARAAVAAGADGIMVEVHNHPEEALSDGPQSLLPNQFASLMEELRIIAWAIGRKLEFETTKSTENNQKYGLPQTGQHEPIS